jgi:hypothetical protein
MDAPSSGTKTLNRNGVAALAHRRLRGCNQAMSVVKSEDVNAVSSGTWWDSALSVIPGVGGVNHLDERSAEIARQILPPGR